MSMRRSWTAASSSRNPRSWAISPRMARYLRLFTLEGSAIVSAVKAAEDPERPGIIVRLFCGMHEGDATAKLVFAEPVHRACICDLRERETEELAVDGATVELPVLKHCRFITVYVE